ncbi:hypothetical protein BJV78DRAFT_616155 [Lactifluus subvellereus]|nr:hypothetical protein BJV78DRAFT_616155 [Lactifluus subvellereus]
MTRMTRNPSIVSRRREGTRVAHRGLRYSSVTVLVDDPGGGGRPASMELFGYKSFVCLYVRTLRLGVVIASLVLVILLGPLPIPLGPGKSLGLSDGHGTAAGIVTPFIQASRYNCKTASTDNESLPIVNVTLAHLIQRFGTILALFSSRSCLRLDFFDFGFAPNSGLSTCPPKPMLVSRPALLLPQPRASLLLQPCALLLPRPHALLLLLSCALLPLP